MCRLPYVVLIHWPSSLKDGGFSPPSQVSSSRPTNR